MRPTLPLLGLFALALALAALLLAGVVLPRRAEPAPFVSAPGPEAAVAFVPPSASSGRAELPTPGFAGVGDADLGVRIATYGKPATASIRLAARTAAGAIVQECSYRPGSYADGQLLLCPLDDVSRVASIVVSASGATGPVGVYANGKGAATRAGAVYRPSGTDRVRHAWNRLASARLDVASPPVIFGGFALSVVALGAGMLVALGRPPLRRPGETSGSG